ncbi:hypothetical protein NECAME_09086 [Necator americanus]|uniref:Uncharacterized protein n=1 Tax=Necator americanus TaxID=51031 RepID=W2TFB8_NECAM|nr:hypothetical protein NECAME_09086 [Necator americanus]ETN80538.1 hypothetical protein NECAME_09086 [Necator americanus]
MKEKSVQLIEPAPSTAYIPPKKDPPKKSVVYQRPRSPYLQAEASDDERFLTPTGRGSEYGTPEPDAKEERRSTDFAFDEKSLKVTAEDIKQEIPTGTAAARIAKFNVGGTDAANGGTVQRNFRPSPVRIPFLAEVNNNASGEKKPKAPSKWAPVECGGLRQPTRVNVPMDRNERAHSEVRTRSSSNLQEPSSFERARTQSPTPREPVNSDLPKHGDRKNAPKEISVSTDFSAPPLPKSQPPSINEIPPSPKTSVSHPYSYSKTAETARNRSPTPSSEKASPSPSLSSASLPSPSSISPGSTSPDLPRKRNPAFDKAKEMFSGSAETRTPSPRPNLLKDSVRRSPGPDFGSIKETKKEKSSTKEASEKSKSTKWRGSLRACSSEIFIKESWIYRLIWKDDREQENLKFLDDPEAKPPLCLQKRVINVPISAPWYQRSLSTTQAPETGRAHRVVVRMDPFASLDMDSLRRNYQFNIDLSSDSPLSIVNR